MLKRVISIFMCLTMMVSMLPVQTIAMETEETQELLLVENSVEELMTTAVEPIAPEASQEEPVESTVTETEAALEEPTEPTVTETEAALEESTEPTATETEVVQEEPTESIEETESVIVETTEPMVEDVIVSETVITGAATQEAMESSAVVVAAADVVAQGTCGANLTWTLDIDGVLTISGTGSMDNYSYNGAPWYSRRSSIKTLVLSSGMESIGDYALYDCSVLTGALVIPDSVTAVGNFAFYSCSKLTSLTLGSSLETIGNSAFNNCSGLTGSLVIPDSVTAIGNAAFNNCSGLTGSLVIPDSVTAIGTETFRSCGNLTGLILGSSLETIGNYAFHSCSGFTGNLYIPDTVATIGEYAFYDCSGFNGALHLPAGLKTVAQYVFYNCSGLTGALVVPDSVTTLNAYCFSGMAGITSVTLGSGFASKNTYSFSGMAGVKELTFTNLTPPASATNLLNGLTNLQTIYVPAGVYGAYADKLATSLPAGARILPIGGSEEFLITDGVLVVYTGEGGDVVISPELGVEIIGTGAFQNCTGLTSVTIPDTVTEIGKNAFDGCSGLTAVEIPETLTSLGNYAFRDCSGLETVNLPEGLQTIGSSTFSNCIGLTAINLPEGLQTIGASTFYNCTGVTAINLPEGLQTIGNNAFQKCTKLKTVDLPETLTYLGSGAFRDCTALEAVDLPNRFTTTGTYMFYNCTALKTVDWPNGLKTIGAYTLYNCKSLSTLDLPATVTTISDYAFQKCTGLVMAELPAALTSLGQYAFHGCTSLAAVSLPDTLSAIGDYAFRGCTGLVTAELPAALTGLGQHAFQGCTSLAAVSLPDTLTTISDYAFQGCTGLATVSMSAGLTSLGQYAFQGCTSLAEVDLPDKVTALGKYAFQGCTGLMTADLSCAVTTISDYAFESCSSLAVLTLPEKLSTVGQSAFQSCKALIALDLPDTLTTISSSAFYNCSGLTGTLEIPEKVTRIDYYAFGGCSTLTGLDLGNVTTIGARAFYNCKGLIGDLVIPDTVTSLGDYAFSHCSSVNGTLWISNNLTTVPDNGFEYMSNLTAVVFGKKVQKIGVYSSSYNYNPFYQDSNVKEITFLSATPPTMKSSLFTYTALRGLKTIYVAAANLITYKNKFSSTLPDGVSIKAYDDYSDFIMENGVLVTYVGEETEVKIPNQITSIGDGAFRDNTDITKVIIPDTVTAIGSNAFYNCAALTEVNLPKGLLTIGNNAFVGSALTGTLAIPEGVTSIGNYAFSGCRGLTGELTIPESVTAIGNYAFQNCTGLTGILTVCGNVDTLGTYVFSGCTSVTEVSFRGTGISTVGSNLFNGMTSLTTVSLSADAFSSYAEKLSQSLPSKVRFQVNDVEEDLYVADNVLVAYQGQGGDVVIPEGVTAIGPSAFQHCTGLTSVSIPDTVTSIGSYTFDDCTGLTGTLVLPENLQTIGGYAFYGCNKIAGKLLFPDTMTTIGSYSFYNANGITALEFGAGFQNMQKNAFYGCNSVTEMVFNGTTVPTMETGTIASMGRLEKIYVPGISYEAYSQVLRGFMSSSPFRVIALDAQEEFRIENGVITGYFGMGGNVVIPEGVTAIGAHAFANCTELTKLIMPDTVTAIESYAFYKCSKLESVTWSANLQSIGTYAFYFCTGLTGMLNVPQSVKTISSYAFSNCSGLTGLTLGNSITTIGSNAFAFCAGMRGDLILPDSLTSLGSNAFDNARFDGKLILSSKLTSIPQYAFYNTRFTGLLTIPGSVKTLNDYSFASMEGITTLTFDSSFSATLNRKVFEGCTGITEMTFLPLTVPSLGGNLFSTMTGLEVIYVPAASYDAYVAAFRGYLAESMEISANFLNIGMTNLRAEQVYSKTVSLSWLPHVSEDVTGYTISRDGIVMGTTDTCSFKDQNLTPGQTYVYSVQGYTADGETTAATELTVTTTAPKATNIRTENGSMKVYEGSNRLWATVSHGYAMDQSEITGTFYYLKGDEQIQIGTAVVDTDLSSEYMLVFTAEWELETLADGDYTIVFTATDPDGAVSQCRNDISIDRSVPEKIAAVIAVDNVTQIKVNWAIAAEMSTNSYRIYRRAATDAEFQLIAQINNRNTLTYTDTNVRSDRIYFYYVVGVNELGREGEPSEIAGATLLKDTTEPVVTQLTPANGSWLTGRKTITLTAEDNVQVASAQLHYSQDAGESWTLLAELDRGNWHAILDTTLLNDGVIRVKATAYDTAGNASRDLIYDYAIDNTGPQQVKNLSYSSTNVTATLRWSTVSDPDIRYFRVEQQLDSGAYTKVTDVSGTLGANLYGLTPGMQYVYRVVGYDIHGNRGIPSESITVVTQNDFIAPVITDIQPDPGYYSDRIPLVVTACDEYTVESLTIQTSLDRICWEDRYVKTYPDIGKTQTLRYMLDLSDFEEGAVYVRAVAKDSAGNESAVGVDAPFVQYMVDRTPPAAPENVKAEGGSGFVKISWSQGPEQDLGSYSVYRAASSGGSYQLIASGLKAVSYYDRGVSENTTYYYKVSVQDQAGNDSVFSRIVSAAAAPDTEKPEIVTIYPASGSVIGPDNCSVSITATDNRSLALIRIEYGTDGESFRSLCELRNPASYGEYAAAELPLKTFTHGQTVYVRAFATDHAGNESDIFRAEYTVDAVAPVANWAAAEFDTDHVTVSWKGNNEPDLSRYRIYRGEDGQYTLIGTCEAESGKIEYSFRDNGISGARNLYRYQVEAVDRCGNTSWIITDPVDIPDRNFPRAVISCDNTMQYGVEYLIDATGSWDDAAIVSYLLDLGDGTTVSDSSIVHAYSETGEYTITLTVTDLEGNQSVATKTVTVVDRALLGTIRVFVKDEYGAAVPGAWVYLDLGDADQAMKKTNSAGYVTFTAQVGAYTLGCIIPDNQWLPTKKDVIVSAGMETPVTMTLVHQPMIQGEFEVNRMSFEEIVAAGIDVQNPANQHMVRVNVSLTYGESQSIDTSFIFNMTTKESTNNNIRLDTNNDGKVDREFVPVILGGEKEDSPVAIAYLDLPIGVSFLKEFFDVNLHIINNASSDFSMTNNVVTLNVPDGLSVVPAAGKEDYALVKVPEIPGQTSKTISWILRGDKEGTYNLTANYSGILSEFAEPIYTTFVSKEPLKVYGLSAVKLIAQINSTIQNDAFYFDLALENVSDIDVNMPSVEVMDNVLNTYLTREAAREEGETSEIWNPEVRHLNTVLRNASGNSQYVGAEVTTLRPGERLTKQYAVYNVVGFLNVLHLRSAIAEIADAAGLAVEVIETDMDLFNMDNAAQKLAELSGDKKALYEYILRGDQFFYVMESVNTDAGVLAEIADGNFDSARNLMNINGYAEEARAITRKMVAQLLLDVSLQEAIADRSASKYREVLTAGLSAINSHLGEQVEEMDQQIFAAYVQNSENLRKLCTTFQKNGRQGFETTLLNQLSAQGMSEETCQKIRLYCQTSLDAVLQEACRQACTETGEMAQQLGESLEDWYDSEDLLKDMIAISAAYAESEVLLEMLLTHLAPGSAAAQEIQQIRTSLDAVKTGQIAQVLDQLAAGSALTPETVSKYLDDSFGVNTGACYTFVKLIFGAAYDALTWNDFSDGKHVLQLNTELSFALTDAVKHHGLSADTNEQAVHTLKALKYLIRMRMLGEQNYVNYCSSLDSDARTEQLAWVNANMGASYSSLQAYASDILTLLSEYRDTIFATYYTKVDIPEAPVVTINYLTSTTNEIFSGDYEYSFDGTQWNTGMGTVITIQPGTVPKSLRVRKKESSSNFAGNVARVVIPAMPRIAGDIQVSRSNGGYKISGLEAGSYQYGFTDTQSIENLSGSFTATAGETVTLQESGNWVYLAIRKDATETAFVSQIRYLVPEAMAEIASGTCGKKLTWTLNEEGVLTISGEGAMDNYTAASEQPWYDYQSSITAIVITDNVTIIGIHAFSGCAQAQTLTIGQKVTEIKRSAFEDCSSLKTVTIPAGVTSIGENAFYRCSSLTGVTIPDSVTSIGSSVFYGCSSLTSVNIPDGVTSIGNSVFNRCTSLTSVTIPDSVASIGDSVFSYCSSLSSVTIPDSVTSIGSSAFSGCSSLSSVTIPDSVTSIGSSAFSGCSSLTSVNISDGVSSIGSYTFNNCGSLTSVTIPDSVTSIGNNAFYNCSSLTSITLPDSLTSIGNDVFYDCGSLTSVTIPEGVTSIGDRAFYGCRNLRSVTIPDSVTSIGRSAFHHCNSLISVTIPNSVTSIASSTFNSCSSLTSVTIPNNVTSIGGYAFYYCSSLTNVTIPDSVTSIESSVFSFCSSLTSVAIPNNVTSIGGAAFYKCSSLISVTIPDTVTSIDNAAFSGCSSLPSVTIPDSVSSIGDYAFYNCSSIASVNIPDGITSIGNDVFYGCSSLTSVTIPDSVTSIGEFAFSHCSSLTSVTIPDGVTSIGDYAFSSCTSLPSVNIPDSVTSIGSSVFYNCSSLPSITIPAGVSSIGAQAFYGCSKLTEMVFECNAPSIESDAFKNVKATAYYPAGNATWTEEVRQNYGGTITWVPYTLENCVTVNAAELTGQRSVWIDGVEYALKTRGDTCYVDLPDGTATTMTAYTYHEGDAADIHTRYPVSMKVWTLSNTDGIYTITRVEKLDNILQYSGMSIRVTGKKGIRMITSIEKSKKNALVSDGLSGYTLKEYGTVVAWATQLEKGNPLLLGQSYVKSNYAYKKGVADPVFAYNGNLMQYTNVLVGFSLDQCKYDLAMRPYMILADTDGDEITLYGGIVQRSIGYIAAQNANTFDPITEADAYNFIWDMILHVYGENYVPEAA